MNYFNEGESEAQARFAAMRDRGFKPLVRCLDAIGCKPWMISLMGVLCAITAAALPPYYWPLILIFILLYIFMDAIDGPLARLTHSESPGGSLIDIFCDQVGVMIFAVGAVYWLGAFIPTSIAYAFLYIHVVYLMVLCNSYKLKIPKVIRVKYFYFLIYLYSMAISDSLYIDLFMVVFLFYYIIMFFSLSRVFVFGVK